VLLGKLFHLLPSLYRTSILWKLQTTWCHITRDSTPQNTRHHTENCRCRNELASVDPWLTPPRSLREKEKSQKVHSVVTALKLNQLELQLWNQNCKLLYAMLCYHILTFYHSTVLSHGFKTIQENIRELGTGKKKVCDLMHHREVLIKFGESCLCNRNHTP
jgi:hypothetical protein